MAALPIQSDRCNDLINSYNQDWGYGGIAWIEKKENGEFQALNKLAFLTPTAKRVQKAVNDTDEFIGKYKYHIFPKNKNHEIFLSRVNQSFSKEFCGYVIDTTDLSRKISSIFSYHIPTSHTDENLHDKLELYNDYHPISSDSLPYDDAKYKEIDVIFLVDGLYAYPAHRTEFLKRGEHWKELFNGHNNIVHIPGKSVTPDGLLSFLHVIYNKPYSYLVEDLLTLEKCARYFHEECIYQKCERMVGRKLGYLELQHLWKCMQITSEKGDLRNRIEFDYALAVINSEIEEVTPEMLNELLECETLPCSEIELLRFLEKWTEHHERDFVSYLDRVRFEWMNLKDFIDTVVAKKYLNDASEKLYFEVIQERQKNGGFPDVKPWKPRDYRNTGKVQIVDKSKESTIKKTLRVNLPLTKDQKQLTNTSRIIIKSLTFFMFDEKWSISVKEVSRKSDNYFGVYLSRDTYNIYGPIRMSFELKVGGGIEGKTKFKRTTWSKEHKGWGCRFIKEHFQSLEGFVENNHINITLNIEDPKKLVYGKPS